MNGEHDVGRDDGGIHIGKVASVVLPYPCVLVLSADDKKDTRAEGVIRCLGEFCAGLGALDRPDLERLLVDGGRRKARCLEDAVQGFVRDIPVREGTTGETLANEFVEFHNIASFMLICLLYHTVHRKIFQHKIRKVCYDNKQNNGG